MNPSSASYVAYGTGNMLNIDVGTIKRKLDSNEYDDEIHQEAQPNGKRACSFSNRPTQFATFGSPTHLTAQYPVKQVVDHSQALKPTWTQIDSSPFLRHQQHEPQGQTLHHGYHTPESEQSSATASPPSMDMEMDAASADQDSSIAAFNNVAATAPPQDEYVPMHGRSMEIPSYARVPMSEMRKYREQRWSSCIYGADSRLGQGMMV
ncbi:hypothetical protein BGW38_008990 [Lunasporangiospora selenospora]|uniref:Uncharacterized protein n=1 Tax=Lunasporangiospora selenospora TaxID=979761 RepID=A0A9P6FK31_9FUNG|nr:hypothetical protein BGW38_008990 [Lunasporangiospora selenospora]